MIFVKLNLMKFNKKRFSKSQMMREGCMCFQVTYSGDKVGQEEFKDFDELNKYLQDLEKNDIETFNCIQYIVLMSFYDYRFCIGSRENID